MARLDNSDDKVVMPTEERWRRKAFQLMTATGPAQRQVSKLLHSLLRNTVRCIRLLPTDIPVVPPTLYRWAPSEDVYLIEAYVASNAANLLVTTDETLFEKPLPKTGNSPAKCEMISWLGMVSPAKAPVAPKPTLSDPTTPSESR